LQSGCGSCSHASNRCRQDPPSKLRKGKRQLPVWFLLLQYVALATNCKYFGIDLKDQFPKDGLSWRRRRIVE
ncbi:MAG: hypothetical protein ACREDL_19295, partial [Bradyrhizobium sp.]